MASLRKRRHRFTAKASLFFSWDVDVTQRACFSQSSSVWTLPEPGLSTPMGCSIPADVYVDHEEDDEECDDAVDAAADDDVKVVGARGSHGRGLT